MTTLADFRQGLLIINPTLSNIDKKLTGAIPAGWIELSSKTIGISMEFQNVTRTTRTGTSQTDQVIPVWGETPSEAPAPTASSTTEKVRSIRFVFRVGTSDFATPPNLYSVWLPIFDEAESDFAFVYQYNRPALLSGNAIDLAASDANPQYRGIGKVTELIPWTASGSARVDQSNPVPARIESTPLLVVDAVIERDFAVATA